MREKESERQKLSLHHTNAVSARVKSVTLFKVVVLVKIIATIIHCIATLKTKLAFFCTIKTISDDKAMDLHSSSHRYSLLSLAAVLGPLAAATFSRSSSGRCSSDIYKALVKCKNASVCV